MTPEDFAPLIDIAKARRQQAEAHHAKITLRERQLRDLLADMAEQFQQGLTQPTEALTSMHGLGAHQAWVDFARRKRADITRDLALVMAEKLESEAVLRHAFGQCEALKALHLEACHEQRKKQEARAQENMLARHMLRDLTV